MSSTTHYDYIILGAGCSGLSLVVRMIESGAFTNKKILIIERAPKTLNDRTWCFWEQPSNRKDASVGFFDAIVFKEWKQLWLKHPQKDISLALGDYSYKMIRGKDFYQYCFDKISTAAYVHIHYGEVTAIDPRQATIDVGEDRFVASYIFSSILLEPPLLQPNEYYLLQHFRGWWIETDENKFDPSQADLMNFKTSQQHGCTFLYVLPVSATKALVEYTLFTEDELESNEYDKGLQQFIENELQLNEYRISEVEHGVIPMTNLRFPKRKEQVYFIGTAGGQTKASTGYTFRFIQKQTAAIVDSLIKTGRPVEYHQPGRFNFYDTVLLHVLHAELMPGAEIFLRMFDKNKASRVLRFLDNESNVMEELQIMNSSKKSVFLPVALKELF